MKTKLFSCAHKVSIQTVIKKENPEGGGDATIGLLLAKWKNAVGTQAFFFFFFITVSTIFFSVDW